ncbi:clavesin-2-like [Uloborus diversus]|uniref:clavesin-2-like n=1 Tax=Uloborus diversus TaxID=327109 RepID=UPI002409B77A|nr:clavesin-2-like [Uloborus diversus]
MLDADMENQGNFLPLMCENLSAELKRKAEKELNETEDSIKEGLVHLKDFIKRTNIDICTDNAFLIQFLRGAKFNLRKSEEKIKWYLRLQKTLGHFLQNNDIETIESLLDLKLCGLLPYRDKNGRCILYSQGSLWNSEQYSADQLATCLILLCQFAILFPPTMVSGLNYIGDSCLKTHWDHCKVFKAATSSISSVLSLPMRLQRIDVIKESSLYHNFLTGLRVILPKKIKNRIHAHGKNLTTLQDSYGSSILPFEFGGTMGPLTNNSFKSQFLEYVRSIRDSYKY